MEDFEVIEKQKLTKTYINISISLIIIIYLFLGVYYINKSKDEKLSSTNEKESSIINELSSSSEDVISSSEDLISSSEDIKVMPKLFDILNLLNESKYYLPSYYDINSLVKNIYKYISQKPSNSISNICSVDGQLKITNNGKLKYEYFTYNQENEYTDACINDYENVTKYLNENINTKIEALAVVWGIDGDLPHTFYFLTENKIYTIDYNYFNQPEEGFVLLYEESSIKKIIEMKYFQSGYGINEVVIRYSNDPNYYFIPENGYIYNLSNYYKDHSIIGGNAEYDSLGGSDIHLAGINSDRKMLLSNQDYDFYSDIMTKKDVIVDKLIEFESGWIVLSEDKQLYYFDYESDYLFGKVKNFSVQAGDINLENFSKNIFSLSIELEDGQKLDYINEK